MTWEGQQSILLGTCSVSVIVFEYPVFPFFPLNMARPKEREPFYQDHCKVFLVKDISLKTTSCHWDMCRCQAPLCRHYFHDQLQGLMHLDVQQSEVGPSTLLSVGPSGHTIVLALDQKGPWSSSKPMPCPVLDRSCIVLLCLGNTRILIQSHVFFKCHIVSFMHEMIDKILSAMFLRRKMT